MNTTPRVKVDPEVMLGKPVIEGTRITVELILRKLSEGASYEELLEAYPQLCREDIDAVKLSEKNGIPPFPVSEKAQPITLEHVKNLEDEPQ